MQCIGRFVFQAQENTLPIGTCIPVDHPSILDRFGKIIGLRKQKLRLENPAQKSATPNDNGTNQGAVIVWKGAVSYF